MWAKHEAKSEVLKYRERRKKEWLCFRADVVKKLDLELRSMDGMLQHQRECCRLVWRNSPRNPGYSFIIVIGTMPR